MIIYKLRNIGDLSIGNRPLQAVYVVLKKDVHLVWRKVTSLFNAWFHDQDWSRDRGWFHD